MWQHGQTGQALGMTTHQKYGGGDMEGKIIYVEIVQSDIEHRVSLAEFRDQLIKEIGSVTLTITKAQFERKVSGAVDRVIQRIRDEKAR